MNVMKRSLFFAAVIAASALTGAATAWCIGGSAAKGNTVSVSDSSSFASQTTGSHFTSYEAQNYPDLTYAAENAVKAVVNIEKTEEVQYGRHSSDPFFDFFFGVPQGMGEPQERRSGGSGVIISEDGYIVTNNHVVENASKLRVKLNDNRIFDAEIVGTDPTTDVALIKIDAKELPTIPFGSSDNLRLGEWVLAIGSPFDLQSTITAGIVSAKARQLNVIPNEFSIESFIQTDAAVNPGNSGGALVNARGELVGINTVIKSSTGSYIGYSFAVPESIVKKVVIDLKEYGVVQRAMLGISYRPVDQQFIEEMGKETGIDEIGGAYVASVDPDGAASAAGIRKGDVITAINGVKINDRASMSEQIGKYRPNDKVKISIKRGGETKQIEVTLRNKAGKTELVTKDDVDVAQALGGKFAEINDKAKRELDIDGGIQVISIKQGGLLSKARVREGFVITHINDRQIRSIADLNKISDKVVSIDGIYPNGRSASYNFVK